MDVAISGFNNSNNMWTMKFDLGYICENCGKKYRDENGTYTILTIPHTRRILKIIKQYADDYDEIVKYLSAYPKVLEIWNKLKQT